MRTNNLGHYMTIGALSVSLSSYADHKHLEEVLVEGQQLRAQTYSLDKDFELAPLDTAQLLTKLPGANVNSNGPITGIVQYRGLYGNRVSINIDSAPALTGGPNSMDTPLSYTPPLLLKEVKLHRGISSVSVAQQSIGGHLEANLDRGEFTSDDDLTINAALTTRMNSNPSGNSTALKSALANQHHKVSLLASYDEGDNIEFGGSKPNEIGGTHYQRNRFDIGYGYQQGDTSIQLYSGVLDTRNTGTPALPMDINYIDSELAGISAKTQIGDTTINANFDYSHVDHGMDNFTHREPPASPMSYRFNHATALGKSWKIQADIPLEKGQLSLGTDGNLTRHNSDISNPNSAAFRLHNFNDIEQDLIGVFAQWNTELDQWKIETGVRYNRVEISALPVSAIGLPAMMAMNVNLLASAFNNSDRNIHHDNVDLVFKAETDISESTTLLMGLARKNRAPSYQESYLWLPLSATGGLADGRNYIGNLDLDSETSHEINLGINWQSEAAWLSPQLFYRKIDDYIQGVPSTNMTANMVSTMMTGKPPLMFDNVDAKMYGFDTTYGYHFNDHLMLEGTLSYVRGKRTDISDSLYRVAPLSHRLSITYSEQDWSLTAESQISAKQNKVSSFNNEQASAGFGIINLQGSYRAHENITISGGVDNLFDKRYQDHLAGYNRNGNSDVPLGERLLGAGRNIYIALKINW